MLPDEHDRRRDQRDAPEATDDRRDEHRDDADGNIAAEQPYGVALSQRAQRQQG